MELALRSQESFGSFMLQLGWRTDTHILSVQNLGGIGADLLQLAGDGLNPGDAPRAIGLLANFFDAVRSLGSATDLPDTIDAGEFASDFPQQLTDYLIATYLLQQRPPLGAILLAGGVIVRSRKPAAGKRPAYERLDIAWSSVGDLLHDALSALRNAYGWGTPAFAQQSFVDNMVTLGEALGYDVFSHSISAHLKGILNEGAPSTTSLQDAHPRWRIFGDTEGPATVELGVDLFVLPATASAQPGIAVSPYAAGLAGTTLDITDSLSIALKGDADISRGVLVSMRPGQAVAVTSDLLSESPATGGEFSATFQSRGETGSKTMVLGSGDGSRFEYGTLALTLGARLASGPSFFAEAAMTDAAIVISPGADADGFIASLLPSELRVNTDLTIGFDSMRGAYFGGAEGLVIEIPAHISLGPLDIISATIAVQGQGEAIPVALGATFRGTIGPVAVQIDNVGLIVDLSFPGRGANLGPVNAALRYQPPAGVGIAVDGPAVSGGGYLFFDPDKGQYGGVVRLSLDNGLTLTAIGLIATRLPGGARGFSFLVIITAEDFKPVPLGLGFTLTGIGGLLAINRTCNEEFLRDGLKNKALDALMFPADPIKNAAHILSALEGAFPAHDGSYLFGPMLQISWGTPPVLTMDLAAVLELGHRNRLIILGRLAAILPSETNDLLRLQMSALGVIDLDQGSIALDAVLYDSRLVGKFPVTGSMAMRVSWGNGRMLALSIGGFHPAFKPPPAFPVLERLAITFSNSSDFRLRAEKYIAITSNTLQFGAKVELYASAGGFAVAGLLGYDVLIQLDPFAFVAGFQAAVQLRRHSHNLFKVSIQGELSGPRPLHIRGKATFEIFWCEVSVRFDKTLVSGERPSRLPPVNVTDHLLEALNDARNWGGQLSDADRGTVTLRQTVGADEIRLHPLGRLSVTQTVVPLELDIARFGHTTPADARRFDISTVTVNDTAVPFDRLRDFFAPAQFLELSDDEKLTAPSFEPMVAGISVGQPAVRFPASDEDVLEDDTIVYETIIIGGETPPAAAPAAIDAAFVTRYLSLDAASTSPLRRSGAAKYRVAPGKNTLRRGGWTIASRDDGSAQGGPDVDAGAVVSYAASFQALAALRRTNTPRAKSLMLVRTAMPPR